MSELPVERSALLRRASEPIVAWRGVLLIAATYIYFLIFAQFGFLNRLAELGIGQETLTPIMAAMAAGGVLASVFGQPLLRAWSPAMRVRAGFAGCAVAAGLSACHMTPVLAGCTAALIGLSLGVVTVTLVAHLRLWTGKRDVLWTAAAGTGVGYFICNVPALFTASPRQTALVSVLCCVFAVACSRPGLLHAAQATDVYEARVNTPYPAVVLAFTALIWLDSAAFFIIQNSPALKAGMWSGAGHLWRNGVLHLAGAGLGAWLMSRRGLSATLLPAFACIAVAGLLLHDTSRAGAASLFYPTGVSLYSVALVASPSILLRHRSQATRGLYVGVLYAVAGWIGSAMGIGMGQHLHRIPTAFIVAAGIAIACPPLWQTIRTHRASILPVLSAAAVVLLALGLDRILPSHFAPPVSEGATQVMQGRQVYIAEGCIHCHSQYIRPHDAFDMTMWGPARNVEEIRREQPPLIGNRRQGPDLSEVGSRRSPLWLRIHFIDPRAVSYRSIMPSYKGLFLDDRGDALIAYVRSLESPDAGGHLQALRTSWQPSVDSSQASEALGANLFQQHCATCHVAGGRVRSTWGNHFRRTPPNLFADELPLLPQIQLLQQRQLSLERIIKFGVSGTDMPGHEYLPDAQVVALAHWLLAHRTGPSASLCFTNAL